MNVSKASKGLLTILSVIILLGCSKEALEEVYIPEITSTASDTQGKPNVPRPEASLSHEWKEADGNDDDVYSSENNGQVPEILNVPYLKESHVIETHRFAMDDKGEQYECLSVEIVLPSFDESQNPALKKVNDYYIAQIDGKKEWMHDYIDMFGSGESPQPRTIEHNFSAEEKFDRFLCVSSYEYYDGGAHPNSWYESDIFDLQTGERLAFSDLFKVPKGEYDNRIQQEINNWLDEKGYYTDGKKNEDSCPFYPDVTEKTILEEIDTFYFTDDGIMLFYNLYVLKPRVAGNPDSIIIPYENIEDILSFTVLE